MLASAMKNEILKDAESIYKSSGFRTTISGGSSAGGNKNTVKIKVISKLNFVIHVNFEVEGSRITGYSCDGTGAFCGRCFCGHCLAALRYMQDDEGIPLTLSEGGEVDDPSEANEESPAPQTVISDDDVTEAPAEITHTPEINSEPDEEIVAPAPTSQDDTAFAPRQISVLLGTTIDEEREIIYTPNDTDRIMNMNMGIIGTTGTGKTQFTKSLVTQLYRGRQDNFDGSPFGILIFDYKGDYNETKQDFIKAVNARVIKPYKMPYNPLSLNLREKNNRMLLPRHTASVFAGTIAKIYNLGPKQENTLFECIMEAYKQQRIADDIELTWRRSAPTIETVYRIYKSSGAADVNDMLSVVMNRLRGFVIFDPDPDRVIPLSKLLDGVVVIDLSENDTKMQNLVVAITLEQFYAQMHTFGSSKTDGRLRQIRNLILVDEADNFMKTGLPVLRGIMKEGREFGVGTILSTQSLSHFNGNDDDYSRYISSWVIHNVNDLSRRSIEAILNQSQKSTASEELFRTIKGLKKHESVVKLSGGDPIVMRDKPFWELNAEGVL